jgi:catechol 2,3-dioxygenase-like lactoylglutathione lyase family enzyme
VSIGEIGELIVYVRDMGAMVAFYRDRLGLSIAYPAGLDDYSGEHWVTFGTGQCTLALHSGRQDSAAAGQPRFGFFVDDIEARRSELLKQGVDCGEVRVAAPGIYVCDARDAEGNGFFIEQHEH